MIYLLNYFFYEVYYLPVSFRDLIECFKHKQKHSSVGLGLSYFGNSFFISNLLVSSKLALSPIYPVKFHYWFFMTLAICNTPVLFIFNYGPSFSLRHTNVLNKAEKVLLGRSLSCITIMEITTLFGIILWLLDAACRNKTVSKLQVTDLFDPMCKLRHSKLRFRSCWVVIRIFLFMKCENSAFSVEE